VLPVTEQEAAELASQGEQVDLTRIGELGRGRRRLKVDYPKGEPRRVTWAEGGFSVMPGY